jgi:hypothetical protein
MKRQGIKQWILFILLSYLVIGSVYYLSSYFYNLVIGKQNVFSPIIGLPLTLLGWPQMVYADLVHRSTLGLKFPTILTLVLLVTTLVFIIIRIVKKNNCVF